MLPLYNKARKQLKQICIDILAKSDFVELNLDQVTVQSVLKEYLPTECRSAFDFMIRREATPIALRHAYADIFKTLSHDSCVDAVMPKYSVEECLTFIEQFNTVPVTHEFVTNFCCFLCQFSPELSHLLGFSFAYNCDTIDVIQLIHYIAKIFCCMQHEHDVVPDEPEPMINTYNPAKFGRVYYFHKHDCKVRKIRAFTADKTSVNNNFYDIPSSVCNKSFPQVSKKGTLYLYLWFCLIHGHCYWYESY